MNNPPEPEQRVSMAEVFFVWLKIGLLSFGGPAAQIALMHKIVVAEKNWLSEKQYLSALSFCMLLPGPEAMQLATYSGWKMHGVRGGLIAGLLFVNILFFDKEKTGRFYLSYLISLFPFLLVNGVLTCLLYTSPSPRD